MSNINTVTRPGVTLALDVCGFRARPHDRDLERPNLSSLDPKAGSQPCPAEAVFFGPWDCQRLVCPDSNRICGCGTRSIGKMSFFRAALFLAWWALVGAEDGQYYGGDGNYNVNDNGNDDGMQGYNNNYLDNQQQGDDYIKYWTDYQIVAKRCIVYKNVDQIVFQVFTGNDHCTSDPIGTYVIPVPFYMQGYLAQEQLKRQDMGQDDYVQPDAAQYVSCIPYETNRGYYYMQVGCADDSTQAIAINIYQDNQCTKRSVVDGYDDSSIDVSSIQVRSFSVALVCACFRTMS